MRILFVTLPRRPSEAEAVRPWWLVADGRLVASGNDSGWLPRAVERGEAGPTSVVGIADPGAVRLSPLDAEATTPQMRGKAAIDARREALGGLEANHAVAGGTHVAVVARDRMQDWLDWAARCGVGLDHIVPAASLLPQDGTWRDLSLGDWQMSANEHVAILDEPALAATLRGDAPVERLDQAAVDALIAGSAFPLPLDLRSGPFARRRSWRPDLSRLREFAILGGVIVLLALAIPIAEIAKWSFAADALDEEAADIASASLGRPVTIDEAEAALRSEGGAQAGGPALFGALYAAMESENIVRASQLSYANGTVSARLTAPDMAAIQRLLDRLQRDGWQVAARPGPSSNGQASVDLDLGAIR
ncbi:type II secretion system protein GspL [Sphingomicrobium nitratireducens]|uniref:type II secretion system protein GspL n=1 Tax=Sphingomicrobium nitratireducens TaxID=2964666 RepID=UPI0022403F58|nr:type II secretion system protein GspL [Sphingomicrobium nitratireducens]